MPYILVKSLDDFYSKQSQDSGSTFERKVILNSLQCPAGNNLHLFSLYIY